MAQALFAEFTLILLVATIVTIVMRQLRQPALVGYIVSGILISPLVFGIMRSVETIDFLSHIGIAFLLFIVGINLKVSDAKRVGKSAAITGIGQVAFTFTLSFIISMIAGFTLVQSAYIGIALSFSSTIIIMKLLTDRNDTDTLYGKISIGFLIVQDIIAAIALTIIASITTLASPLMLTGMVVLKIGGIALFTYLCMRYLIPLIDALLEKSSEILFMLSITWLLVLGAIFLHFGLSLEIGALIAGLTFSVSSHRYAIRERIKPLRDFFVILFFILIGTFIDLSAIMQYWHLIIIYTFLVLIGNPLIVMYLLGKIGHTTRVGFYAGLTVAQISEFSLVIILLGTRMGHIPDALLSVITMIAIITIALSTYLIMYADAIYPRIERYLRVFGTDEPARKNRTIPVFVFGYTPTSKVILSYAQKRGMDVLIIDYDPETVADLVERGLHAEIGDVTDPVFMHSLDMSSAKLIVSTLPSLEANGVIFAHAPAKALLFVEADSADGARQLYDLGYTYVLRPDYLGGLHIVHLLEKHGLAKSHFSRYARIHHAHDSAKARHHDS